MAEPSNDEQSDIEQSDDECVDEIYITLEDDIRKDEILRPEYIGGFADGDGSIYINFKPCGGFSAELNFTNCDVRVLLYIMQQYPTARLKSRDGKNDRQRTQYYLTYFGENMRKILSDIFPFLVVKRRVAELMFEYLPYMYSIEKERKLELAMEITEENQSRSVDSNVFKTITDVYIAGIFDAEGTVSHDCAKIAQKDFPALLHFLPTYFRFGKVSKCGASYLIPKSKMNEFLTRICSPTIVKHEQIHCWFALPICDRVFMRYMLSWWKHCEFVFDIDSVPKYVGNSREGLVDTEEKRVMQVFFRERQSAACKQRFHNYEFDADTIEKRVNTLMQTKLQRGSRSLTDEQIIEIRELVLQRSMSQTHIARHLIAKYSMDCKLSSLTKLVSNVVNQGTLTCRETIENTDTRQQLRDNWRQKLRNERPERAQRAHEPTRRLVTADEIAQVRALHVQNPQVPFKSIAKQFWFSATIVSRIIKGVYD